MHNFWIRTLGVEKILQPVLQHHTAGPVPPMHTLFLKAYEGRKSMTYSLINISEQSLCQVLRETK